VTVAGDAAKTQPAARIIPSTPPTTSPASASGLVTPANAQPGRAAPKS